MPAKKAPPKLITVYSPDGTAEAHTYANARDLVNGAGYSWNKKVPTTPASLAPFAVPQNKKFKKEKAQEVIDNAGAPTRASKTDDDDEISDLDDEIEVDAEDNPDADETPEDEDADA